jgi:hypothetical protein
MRQYESQLRSLLTQDLITAAGGFVYAAIPGGTKKASLLDVNGAAVANPFLLTSGGFSFYTADAVPALDLYIQSPTGHFVILKNMKSSVDASIFVDRSLVNTTMVIPINGLDQTVDGTEQGAGFTIIGAVTPDVMAVANTTIASRTLTVGTLSSAGGVANGFIAAVPFATAGLVKPSNANGVATTGSLLFVQDSVNAGDKAPEINITSAGRQVSYTLNSGSTGVQGFIMIPCLLPPTSL